MSTHPERISLTVPKAAQAETMVREKDGSESPLETRLMHLMAAQGPRLRGQAARLQGLVPQPRPGHQGVARHRLPRGFRVLEAVRPDFIFFGTDHTGQVVADLVDPHGHHLSDALPKLWGLAAFAEKFQGEFRRIESVAETGGTMRVLDLTKHHVRQAILDANSAKALYESGVASDY